VWVKVVGIKKSKNPKINRERNKERKIKEEKIKEK